MAADSPVAVGYLAGEAVNEVVLAVLEEGHIHFVHVQQRHHVHHKRTQHMKCKHTYICDLIVRLRLYIQQQNTQEELFNE